MADISIKIGTVNPADQTTYQDGDIITVHTDWERDYCCCQRLFRGGRTALCPRRRSGEWEDGGPWETMNTLMFKHLYEVVSANEIRVTENFQSGTPGPIYVVGSTPVAHPTTGKMVHCHVREYLARRRRSGSKLFKKADGTVIWYGGSRKPRQSELDTFWAQLLLDGHGPRPDFWPFGAAELVRQCCITVQDMTADRARELTAHEEQQTGTDALGDPIFNIVRKRKRAIGWQLLEHVTPSRRARYLSSGQAVDLRSEQVSEGRRYSDNDKTIVKPDVALVP